MKQSRVIRKLYVDGGVVYYRFSGSTCAEEARALDLQKDSAGRISQIVFDRVIHDPDVSYSLGADGLSGDVEFTGAVATEMSVSYPH